MIGLTKKKLFCNAATTICGYNSMLKQQKEVEGECHTTTVLFDNNYELFHDRIDIKAVSPITEKEHQIGGSTALLDAIGRTIHKIGNVQKRTVLTTTTGRGV